MEILPIRVFKVRERSMAPTFLSGDYLLVNTWAKDFRKGDVIVLRHPRERIRIVKRISRINGPKFFVTGDNKEESQDSRSFGTVTAKNIIGKVLFRI